MSQRNKFLLLLAFTTIQGPNFIIWNERGAECQRLYLRTLLLSSDSSPYNFHHMSKYSFKSDLFFFSAKMQFFTVIPETKSQSFVGNLPSRLNYVGSSVHFFKANLSEIWLLGGTKVESQIFNHAISHVTDKKYLFVEMGTDLVLTLGVVLEIFYHHNQNGFDTSS